MRNLPAKKRTVADIVAEYDEKLEKIAEQIKDFEAAGDALKMAATIGGTFGNTSIDTGSVYESSVKEHLLKSAWFYTYQNWNLKTIMSAKDQSDFDRAMASPPEFTIETVMLAFGKYAADPWGNILRGLAEVFCGLDQSYKSHEKVKIGVAGLPKRIIIPNVGSFHGWGEKRIEDCLNALAAYQGKPMLSHTEMRALLKDGNCLRGESELLHYNTKTYKEEKKIFPARGVFLKRFNNGNGHLFFEPETLEDINRALAEFYGDILADCHEEKPTDRAASTELSKDLQYYPTPKDAVDFLLSDIYIREGEKVLEPSCGCGRIMDGVKAQQPKADIIGIEVDGKRVREARDKRHNVLQANFLTVSPKPEYDYVVMNPPFYGKHYAKHIEHALKFLKDGGALLAILPASARYDHKLFKGQWRDLPLGAFKESGTNINTTVLKMRKS